jgi:hypothetical protein
MGPSAACEWLVNATPMSPNLGIGAGTGSSLGLIGLREMCVGGQQSAERTIPLARRRTPRPWLDDETAGTINQVRPTRRSPLVTALPIDLTGLTAERYDPGGSSVAGQFRPGHNPGRCSLDLPTVHRAPLLTQ